MASTNKEDEDAVSVAKTPAELQRMRLEKLMKNPAKPVYIPDSSKAAKMREPPEFIRNVWGSSAGAGSGDFHVYRGVRRREYARQKFQKEVTMKLTAEEEYHKKVEENKKAAEEKTAKKRAKRQKKKGKMNKKMKVEEVKKEESSESEEEAEKEKKQKHKEAEGGEDENNSRESAEQAQDSNSTSEADNDTKDES